MIETDIRDNGTSDISGSSSRGKRFDMMREPSGKTTNGQVNSSSSSLALEQEMAQAVAFKQQQVADQQAINNNNSNQQQSKQQPIVAKLNVYDRGDIKPTKKRYLILLLFCLHSMINAAQWIYLSSITNIVARYYQVDYMTVNWTSMIYMVVYIPLVVPASWLFERMGMRNSILIGSIGTTMGSMVKCFACHQDRFSLLMSGQTIVAICQLFVLSVPPRLASIWFPDHQVSLANACGVFGNQLGIALGFVVPQLVLAGIDVGSSSAGDIESGLLKLFVGVTVVSGITSVLILALFDQTPSKPPGLARLQQIKQENAIAEAGSMPLVLGDGTSSGAHGGSKFGQFGALLGTLLTDSNFLLLMVSYGLNVGVFYAISTVLNQMISPSWPGSVVGSLGLVMVISGMFGSIISGYILDKTHKYRLVNATLYFLSLVSLILFTLTLQTHNIFALYLTVTMLGYFMTGYLLIGFEMSNEITWPLPESVSAGLLNLSAQVFGVVLTYVGSSIVEKHGNLIANIFFTLSILIGLLFTIMIRAQMKRQQAIDA